MDAITRPPAPVNEPVRNYAPGSPERAELVAALDAGAAPVELPAVIGGERVLPSGAEIEVVAPFDHARVLGRTRERSARPMPRPRSTPRWAPQLPGAPWISTIGRQFCCARPSCWPARGGPG